MSLLWCDHITKDSFCLYDIYAGKTLLMTGHKATQYGLEYWIDGRSLAEIVQVPLTWQPGGWTYLLEKI